MTLEEALKQRLEAEIALRAAEDRLTEAKWSVYRARMNERGLTRTWNGDFMEKV